MILEAAKPKHRYVVLDSLRGVCACMVVLLHFITQGHISALPVVRNSFLFVDFFFVLSGFVIGSSYGLRLAEGFSIRRFMWLRLGRVYPLHFVVLMAFLGFEIIFALFMHGMADREPFEGAFSLPLLGYSLLLVQIFFGPDGTPWNGPSWSIAAEIWTYLIFALLLRYAFRFMIPVCLLIAIVAPLVLSQLTDRSINVFHDGALLRCLFGFSLGILGWQMADRVARLRPGRWGDHLIEMAVAIGVIVFVWSAGAGPLSLAAPLVFFLAVLVFSREAGFISRLLKCAPFALVGILSYSIYMIHGFLLYRFVNGLSLLERVTGLDLVQHVGGHNSVGGGALFGDMMSVLFLGIVICASWLSYNFVELPGQRFVRRWPERRSASVPIPVAPGAP
ncbi:MAG: hypothetical protein BGP16_13215 [Sphingobium sp. 66-54]|nr:MAG: hypothetical protein BGP16_13215 [Sphingobium sp. 66-54]